MKWPIIFALLTGLFWGTYGPALGMARNYEGPKYPFKPYLMIGLAYLVWAVVGGVAGNMYTQASFKYSTHGAGWGFLAGTLGAVGALTLTLAMFTFPVGMKPRADIVMPIVFGTAVTVSALTATIQTGAAFNPKLWLGIVGMAICIVVVASQTPHAAPHKPSGSPGTDPHSSQPSHSSTPTAEASAH